MIPLALAALAVACPSDVTRAPARYAPLDSVVGRSMRDFSIPGLSLAIVRDGHVEVMRGYGVASAARAEPATSCTRFHVASVTKLFTATAAMRLASERRLDLDLPVSTYLPALRSGSPEFGRITVRQLLQHHSGIDDVFDYGWREPTSDSRALTRLVDSVARVSKPQSSRASYSYSNIGYDLIGAVIQSVSSSDVGSYISAEVLRRAGMRSATLFAPSSMTGRPRRSAAVSR